MTADSIPAQLAAACRAVRPSVPADAVGGVQPSVVATPSSTQEASALLRAAAELGLAVVPRGTGTKLSWGSPPRRCDLVVETTGMNEVTEHASGDLVATVQAGVSLERLAQELGAAGQRLALDPPLLDPPAQGRSGAPAAPGRTRGTVGGVLAAGAAGPLRLRYGTARDLLIGLTIVRPDGTVAKSGGKVVKNVAGYDIGKLFAGSRGTLGLITEATFRLHPVPASVAYVTVECEAAVVACRLIAASLASPLAPVAAEIDWPAAGAPVGVGIALEGDPAGVAERASLLADLLNARAEGGGTGAAAARGPGAGTARAAMASMATAGAARVSAARVSAEPPRWWGARPAEEPGGTLAQVAFWPGDLGLVLAEIRGAAQQTGLDVAIGGSAGAGVLHVTMPADADAGKIEAFVTGSRGALGHGLPAQQGQRLTDIPRFTDIPGPAGSARPRQAGDGHEPAGPGQRRPASGPPARANFVVLHAPPAVGARVDLFGPVPSLALMRAVKCQFDPAGMMSPGRFAGGI